jgi:tetratricopeptide (TPR) repeat protein
VQAVLAFAAAFLLPLRFPAIHAQISPATSSILAQGERDEAANQPSLAEQLYRGALVNEPGSIPLLTHLASVLRREGQLTAAVQYWAQARTVSPSNLQICADLADAYLANGENQQAVDLLQQQLHNDQDQSQPTQSHMQPSPSSLEQGALWLDLGTALARLDRYQDAVAAYRQALSSPLDRPLAQLSLGKALLTLDRYADALPVLTDYSTEHPTSAEAHTLLGIAQEGLGNLPLAEAQLRAANPSRDFDTEYHLGSVLRSEGKIPESMGYLQQAIALRPDSQQAHFQLARAYRSAHQPESAARQESILVALVKAKQSATQIAVLGPQAAEAEHSGDLTKAVALYEQVLMLNAHNRQAAYDLALVYEHQQNRAAERATLVQALASVTQPDVNPKSTALLQAQLGFLDLAASQPQAGEQHLRAALTLDPQCTEALGNLGVLQAQSGKLQDAAHLLQLSVESDPLYERGWKNLGLVRAALGQNRQAVQALQRALALAPADPALHQALDALRQPSTTDHANRR